MDVCVLTSREVGRYEHHDILPNCNEHIHLSIPAVMLGVFDGRYEFVLGPTGEEDWVTFAKEHYLAVQPSGGMPVVQRVERNGFAIVEEAR